MYMCTGFLGGSVIKNPPYMQESWVWSLGQEDSPEKEMATHSRILAWRIPWTEEPGGLQSMRSQRVRHDWVTKQQQCMWMHVYVWDSVTESMCVCVCCGGVPLQNTNIKLQTRHLNQVSKHSSCSISISGMKINECTFKKEIKMEKF